MEGSYDLVAEPVFQRTRAQRLLLEFDDARSGSFEALCAVPDDKVVVLGLVSTKHPALERVDTLQARIAEASHFVSLDRLALSPQCGFASSVLGNALGPEDQRRKLARVVEAAQRVWG